MDVKGFSLLSTLCSIVILSIGFGIASHALSLSRKSAARLSKTLIAEAYAMELVEYFRSQTNGRLAQYLNENPVNGALSPYKLCAHINLLDRTTGILLNEDPLAALPPLSALDGATLGTKANRFYQVQVVDTISLTVNTTKCGMAAGAPGPNEKYFVTVGVSWVTPDNPSEPPHRVVLTTLLPTSI